MCFKDVEKKLRDAGWKVVRTNGSHKQFKHPDKEYVITVPDHGKKDISIGVIKNIEKGTGLSLR